MNRRDFIAAVAAMSAARPLQADGGVSIPGIGPMRGFVIFDASGVPVASWVHAEEYPNPVTIAEGETHRFDFYTSPLRT